MPPTLFRWLRSCCLLFALLLAAAAVQAQIALPAMPEVHLDSVAVAPQAVATSGWLLLDQDIQVELEGAVHNLYNYKFDKAEKQFRSLRRRYPHHPMPYFLLGLSLWWRMMPYPVEDTRFDRQYYAYLDTAETKAHQLLRADPRNYEACFFLSASYGFEARVAGERHQWRRATVASRRALDYLQKSREGNGLSAEFELGYGLFDYYAVWLGQEYPWLRPILFFFPKGNREKGLAELRNTSRQAFYAKTEADFFLTQIFFSAREHRTGEALVIARRLAREYPDNSRFVSDYAKFSFEQGELLQAEAASRSILARNAQGLVGFESLASRSAAYIMGYISETYYHNYAQAQDYYLRCIVFSETIGMVNTGYYIYAHSGLGRLAAAKQDVATARHYFAVVLDKANHQDVIFQEAKTYLRQHPR